MKTKNCQTFKKGHIPWNKGMKGIHLSPDTEFKKGQINSRRRKVGAVTQRTSRKGGTRNFIKIGEPNIWVELAKYAWEKHYGKLKKSDVVHHLNGDILDDRIENLIAMPRCDHPKYHGRWGLSEISQGEIEKYLRCYGGILELQIQLELPI